MIQGIIVLLSSLLFLGCGGATVENGLSKLQKEEKTPIENKKPQTKIEEEKLPIPKPNTIPTASIADKPYSTLVREEGIAINFQADAQDEDEDKLSYLWKENNTTLATTQSFTKNDFSKGKHIITLFVTDSHGATVQDTQTINIVKTNNRNDAPLVTDQKLETDEDTPLSFTLYSYDKEGDTLTLTIIKRPSHGTIQGNFPNLTYSPNRNYKGSDSFEYKVNDGNLDSQKATVYITINDVNDAPTVEAGDDVQIKITNSTWISSSAQDSDGYITSYSWSEEGKELSSKKSFRYTPKSIGKHILKITVTDDKNAKTSDTLIVDVDNKLPLIIIRIEFSNYAFHSDAQTWSNKIFGTDEGELNHFYFENSHGRLQFAKAKETQGTSNDGIITVKLPIDHPGNSHEEIYKDAIALADKYINFSQYDNNNNKAISKKELQIMFLVAGGENATGLHPGVWAHATSYANAPTLDGVKVMENSTQGTYSTFGESHFKDGEDASIGIIAHELGHAAFGLIDLYDIDGGSQGIGNFGLMGSGNWGQKSYSERPGTTPIPMLAWSKIQAKFVEPIEIKQDQSITLTQAKDKDFKPYLIKTSHDKEYFLLENRSDSGYDRGLFVLKDGENFHGGLLLTHIDENIKNNQNPNHKEVDIEEANNAGLDTNTSHRGHINNLYFSGNKSNFTPTTSPNSNLYSGDESGISITNISDSGQTMSADIELGR